MIFEHVGIAVSDLEKSVHFYTTVFGFDVLRRSATIVYLHLDGELFELMQGTAPASATRPQTPKAWREHLWAGEVIHLAFRVDDLDKAIERITDLGGELIVPPYKVEPEIEYVAESTDDKLKRAARPITKPYWRLAVFCDPDGVMLQLVER